MEDGVRRQEYAPRGPVAHSRGADRGCAASSAALGIAVDLWDGEVTVGAITTGGPADREGTLVQGDVIKGVDGCPCNTIEEVTGMVEDQKCVRAQWWWRRLW